MFWRFCGRCLASVIWLVAIHPPVQHSERRGVALRWIRDGRSAIHGTHGIFCRPTREQRAAESCAKLEIANRVGEMECAWDVFIRDRASCIHQSLGDTRSARLLESRVDDAGQPRASFDLHARGIPEHSLELRSVPAGHECLASNPNAARQSERSNGGKSNERFGFHRSIMNTYFAVAGSFTS
jgi:hypothetical protein